MVSPAVERFASDGVLIAGGARAILLQVADPTIAAGVGDLLCVLKSEARKGDGK